MKLIQIRVLPGLRKGARIAKRRAVDMTGGALTGLLIGGLAMTPAPSNASEIRPAHVRQYPQCAEEDGQLCVWRNVGPGYSFVAGKDTQAGPGESVKRFRVSNALADKLIARDNWRQAPAGTYDLVHATRSGQTTVHVGRDSKAVMTIGDTTYVVAGRLVASS